MSKNAKPGNGRLGPIKDRVQFLNPRSKRWTKVNTKIGGIIDVKSNKSTFKSVRKAVKK